MIIIGIVLALVGLAYLCWLLFALARDLARSADVAPQAGLSFRRA
jgi:threonine/homoserine/homoserine lactone efflux protein